MLKNVAGQTVGCQMTRLSTGSEFKDQVTCLVGGDGAANATGTVGFGICSHKGDGFHEYTPSQAETNYDRVQFVFHGTDAITSAVQVYPSTIEAVLALIQGAGWDVTTDTLEKIRDAITAYISSAVGAVQSSEGTIVGFPATLNIGDSYTQDANRAIVVYIRDATNAPITSVGSHNFTDPDFAPELVITQGGQTGRVKATVTYVDPGAAESYLLVEIPAKESRRAGPGAATMQCVLKWTTSGAQQTLATQNIVWLPSI